MNASTSNLNLHLACTCTVANDLLVAADAAEAAELFGNLLKQIIANDSYDKTVLSGGDPAVFQGNYFWNWKGFVC